MNLIIIKYPIFEQLVHSLSLGLIDFWQKCSITGKLEIQHNEANILLGCEWRSKVELVFENAYLCVKCSVVVVFMKPQASAV